MGGSDIDGEFLDRAAVLKFVSDKHGDQVRPDGSLVTLHLQRVADRTEALVRSWYRRRDLFVSPAAEAQIGYVHCGALLHDVVESGNGGCTFDDIVGASNIVVAKLVSMLSYDARLPAPRRIDEYAARLGIAEVEVKIIKLLDLIDDTEMVLALYDRYESDALCTGVERWAIGARRCLGAISRDVRPLIETKSLDQHAAALLDRVDVLVGAGKAIKAGRSLRSSGKPTGLMAARAAFFRDTARRIADGLFP